jgi:hypothetical protein
MRHFVIHDSSFFFQRFGPALGQSYRSRTFSPIGRLIEQVESQMSAFADRYRLTDDEWPMVLACREHAFSRSLWRHYAGELLLHAAADAPSFPLAPDLLEKFLPPSLVARIHRGSRDVVFDGIVYRPGMAGLHDQSDVVRLATELAAIDPGAWTVEAIESSDDPAEELAFARQGFADLRAMIESAHLQDRVIVCEEI